jgi:hypothetical protein
MKPASTYGGTGGSATHSHANTNITTSGPSTTLNTRTGNTTVGSSTHTHTATISAISNESSLPPYTDVIVAKVTGSNTAPNDPTSLDQIEITTAMSIPVGDWSSETQVQFSADLSDTDNPDDLSLCVEIQELGTAFTNTETDCGSSVTYSGSAVTATLTITGLTHAAEYHWQARTKDGFGAYSGWVSFGANAESARDFAVDDQIPSGITYDGTSIGVDASFNDGSLSSLSANWNITDGDSGIADFEYSIGTTSGGTDIVNWTSVGVSTSQTASSLTLQTSQTYYFNIRATDVAGNQNIISSDGQYVSPTLSFSVSPANLDIGTLDAGNGYSASANTTLTTSTNAYNGYTIRAFANNLLNNGTVTVGMFDGATYASPDGWLGGDRGFGYTSSDTLVNGVNRFNPVTCAGGNPSPCYAPFSLSAPGDIVADNTSLISGSPIINEQFTITQRVTTDATQDAGIYRTEIVFSITARY